MAKDEMNNVFRKEMRNLIIILIVFDSSFLLRYLYDELYIPNIAGFGLEQTEFVVIMEMTITQYFWDFIPILVILLFHRSNFSKKHSDRPQSR